MPAFGVLAQVGGGTLLLNQQIANTRDGGNHPHLIDYYVPVGTVSSAMVCLHGGTGSKESFANQLHIMFGTTPTQTNTNWALLNYWNCVAVFPQGQAMTGVVTAENPTGISTVSADHPNGIACWNQYDMNSGVDDVQFLKDLSTHLIAVYGAIARNICGHSAGGFMTQRMWYEAPTYYAHYCCASGCVGINQPTTLPATRQPMHMQFGNDDDILAVLDSVGVNHFFDDTFTQVATNVNRAGYNFPHQSIRVSGWKSLVDRALAISGETVTQGAGVDTVMAGSGGTMTTWTYNTGKLVLRRLAGVGHEITDHQTVLGKRMFNQWMAWIISV